MMVKLFWRLPARVRALAVCVTLCLAFAHRLAAQEFRAAWADVFHVGMGSPGESTTMVNTPVWGNCNAVVVEVLAYMDNSTASHGAHWKSSIVPWSSRVT